MSSIITISAAAAVAVLALAIGIHRRSRAPSQSGLVEAKKNTLRSELHDLGLGIKQVQGYIAALKDDGKTGNIDGSGTNNTNSTNNTNNSDNAGNTKANPVEPIDQDNRVENIRTLATAEIEKAIALKAQIEGALDKATTDAQVDGFALGLGEARRQVQKARNIVLQHQPVEEE